MPEEEQVEQLEPWEDVNCPSELWLKTDSIRSTFSLWHWGHVIVWLDRMMSFSNSLWQSRQRYS